MITELNISKNNLGKKSEYKNDASGIIAIADAIPDMGALTSLNISNNIIGQYVAPNGWKKGTPNGGKYKKNDGSLHEHPPAGSFPGAAAIADAIRNNGALSSLVLKDNRLLTAEAGKILSDMLASNTVLKVLDLSSNNWKGGAYDDLMGDGPGFAKELAVGISDNGALTSLHVGKNNIPEKEMKKIMAVALRKEGMKILCEVPFKDKSLTELDISGKNLGMEGALVVADYLDGNGAMTKLNVSDNRIVGTEGGKILSGMTAQNSVLHELDVSSNCKFRDDDGPGFAKELAIGISDSRALTSLNLASNDIGGYEDEGGNVIATPEGITTLYCAYPTYCFSHRC
jgi:Leucine-rich repeat (LRR) protein